MSSIPCVELRNGVEMQRMGIGTYKADVRVDMDTVIRRSVAEGFWCIDAAHRYHNEKQVGQAIRRCGLAREKLFLTTKIWNEDHGYRKTLEAFERSRELLGTDIDLLLIHWPCPMNRLFADTWKALQELYAQGRVKAIGVSNFKIAHLEALKELGGVQPMVNQVEMHPAFIQWDMLDYGKKNGIRIAAWSALLRGDRKVFDSGVIAGLAQKYARSKAQIILRYITQLGAMVLVKAASERHIRENAQVFAFELEQADMQKMRTLDRQARVYQDPDDYYV